MSANLQVISAPDHDGVHYGENGVDRGNGEANLHREIIITADCVRPIAHWAWIQDAAPSIGARRQRRQSDRYTLPTSALAH